MSLPSSSAFQTQAQMDPNNKNFPVGYFEEGYQLNNQNLTLKQLEDFKYNIDPEQYRTYLSDQERIQFNQWVDKMKANKAIAKDDNFMDYDMQGFWKNEVLKNTQNAGGNAQEHFTDKYKMPNHRTFSNESQYYNEGNAGYAGNWNLWYNNKKEDETTTDALSALLTGG